MDENTFEAMLSIPTPPHEPDLKLTLKILVPFKLKERSLRALNIIRHIDQFATVDCLILNIVEEIETEATNKLYRDMHSAASTYLDKDRFDIVIRHGKPFETIIDTALKAHIHIIILPFSPVTHSFFRSARRELWAFVRKCPIPVLFLPDSHLFDSKNFPVKHSAIFALDKSMFQPELNIAMRSARLLNVSTDLFISQTSGKDNHSREIIDLINCRYLNDKSRSVFNKHIIRHHNYSSILKAIQTSDPDLLIFPDTNHRLASFSSAVRMITRIIQDNHYPVLLIRQPNPMIKLEKNFRKISETLSDYELAKTSDTEISGATGNLDHGMAGSELLFGFFSRQGLWSVFRKFGLIKYLAQKGYNNVTFDVDTRSMFQYRLRIFPEKKVSEKPLMDIVLGQQKAPVFPGVSSGFPSITSSYLVVEWLQLQDPLRKYHNTQTPLPGQDFPGLGVGWQVLIFLKLMAERLNSAGLLNAPQFFHTAWFFHRCFCFASPQIEGQLLAINRDTFPCRTGDVSWAIMHGIVHQINNNRIESYQWPGSTQILPLVPLLKHHFKSPAYRDIVTDTLKSFEYRIDTYKMNKMKKNGLFYRMPGD